MNSELINPSPIIYEPQHARREHGSSHVFLSPRTALTRAHLIRDINDPEHPLTLEQLNVVGPDRIDVSDANSYIMVKFTPTVPHCSMATLIGLSMRVKLLRCLPSRFKVDIKVSPGSHASEAAVNKQLNDKERVAAALENSHLLDVVNRCLKNRMEL
eukprot:tig00021501_g21961.t1